MPLLEAVRLALSQLRVQKLKSFFTLLGVTISVMFLIAVVSIVEGMMAFARMPSSRYSSCSASTNARTAALPVM